MEKESAVVGDHETSRRGGMEKESTVIYQREMSRREGERVQL